MQHLNCIYEEEKRKLNELGLRLLEKGIPLSSSEALQAQSRKVDQLINQMYQAKRVCREFFHLKSFFEGDKLHEQAAGGVYDD